MSGAQRQWQHFQCDARLLSLQVPGCEMQLREGGRELSVAAEGARRMGDCDFVRQKEDARRNGDIVRCAVWGSPS